MKIGIIGSRKYENKRKIKETIFNLKQKFGDTLVIVSGGSPDGADKYAKKYALELDCNYIEVNPSHTPKNLYSYMREDWYGKSYSVRDFANLAFSIAGFQLEWIGKGVDEKGVCKESGAVLVEVDPRYFRPSEVESLLGDASKAKQKLGWKPKHSFQTLVEDMMKSDLLEAEKQAALKSQGYAVIEPHQ